MIFRFINQQIKAPCSKAVNNVTRYHFLHKNLIVSDWVKREYLTDTEVTRTYSMCTGRVYINHTSKKAVRSVLLSELCYLSVSVGLPAIERWIKINACFIQQVALNSNGHPTLTILSVTVNSKFLKCHSKAKSIAPSYSRALHQIRGVTN